MMDFPLLLRTFLLRSAKYFPKKEHPETKIKGEIKTFICNEKARINYGPLKMKLLKHIKMSSPKLISELDTMRYNLRNSREEIIDMRLLIDARAKDTIIQKKQLKTAPIRSKTCVVQ